MEIKCHSLSLVLPIYCVLFGLSTLIFNESTYAVSIEDAAGVVEMSSDGSITLRVFNLQEGDDIISFNSRDDVYSDYIELVDGLLPGQVKAFPQILGSVKMNIDGSLSYKYTGVPRKGGPHLFKRGIILMGSPDYKILIDKLGGFDPGESKAIPYDPHFNWPF